LDLQPIYIEKTAEGRTCTGAPGGTGTGKRMKVLNFLLRMVFGAIGIEIINAILISQNIAIFVGLNGLTLLTVGSLGISGLGLLYGIAAFGIL